MIIDWHAHIYTPEEAANDKGTWDGKDRPSWGVRGCAMVIEKFLRAHYEMGIDVSVVTNAAHYLRGKSANEELAAVQKWTYYAARVQGDHKGACTPLRLSCRAAAQPSSRRPNAPSVRVPNRKQRRPEL
jgi:hypothetical protein